MRVDLNADVGEIPHERDNEGDGLLLAHVTSASIACGFHAGDPAIMRRTIELSCKHGVAMGAHPSFADRDGFGRRDMRLSEREVEDLVLYQVGALAALVSATGATLQHVKPHGALYNMAARDGALADTIARAVQRFDPSLILVGLAGSPSVHAAEHIGLRAAGEGFADRAYRADGSLVPRSDPGAVLHDHRKVTEQALRMIGDGVIVALTGERLRVHVDTLCVHGDTAGAAELAAALRAALLDAGVRVVALAAS